VKRYVNVPIDFKALDERRRLRGELAGRRWTGEVLAKPRRHPALPVKENP